MFMLMAEAAARRSTCRRLNVGAVLVCDNDVVSIGYNGPPSGEPHCTGPGCGVPSCTRAIHAEMNCLERALKKPFGAWEFSTLYVTNSPCPTCTIKVIEAGVKRVIYRDEYRLVDHLANFAAARVQLLRLTPSGYMIDVASGEFVND